ncbi:nitroreductase [Pseudoponticoccus marisrubri]|uniref:Nitroreductase n=1 Tax=Pseudoponticoccus marisrubri TaxID=1685382 RepID=A0A0W7WGS9_9RHOB|nr:nitroreductase [Pseudoponticoccus marisrubri]KUF09809.1 nitroreductase [Pseudoponticoccus marisrubri]
MSDAHAFGALLRRRFSCRGFRPDPVPRAQIAAALEDAQHVPSWCNSQPWQVIACGPEETARLAEALYAHVATAPHDSDIPFPEHYEGVYKDRRSTCGWQLYAAVGVAKGDRAASGRQMRENFRFFGAPQVMFVTTPKALGAYGVLDCGAFVTALLLGLQARGIGSIAMASVAGHAPFLREWLGIAADRDLLCGIALGYPDPDHPANGFRTERAPLAEVVDWR